MTDLYLTSAGNGSHITQKALFREARDAYNDLGEEPLSTQKFIEAYEREFRTLARLQPPRKIRSHSPEQPFADVPTTRLSRLQ